MKPENKETANERSAARRVISLAIKFLIPVVLIAAGGLYAT